MSPPALYEFPGLRGFIGPAIRPGGLTLTREAADRCDLKSGARVLDVGCGTGATVAYLIQERRCRAFGLDRSPVMLQGERAVHARPFLIRGDAHCLPVADARLDAVLLECVLSLADRPADVLQECRRVLKSGGWLILSDIYARNPVRTGSTGIGVRTCLFGAVGEGAAKARVTAAGFAIHHWADHSFWLKQLAGQLVFAFGSQAAFWSQFCSETSPETPPEAMIRNAREMRPGYYLLIARKHRDSQNRSISHG